jgi:hypothetical protein
MRKLVIVVAVAVLVGGAAWAAVGRAGTDRGRTPVNCVDSIWRTTRVSTSSAQFTTVPGFRDAPPSIFPISVQVSAVVSGSPVVFRVLSTNVGGQTHASRPGAARFVPSGGGQDSFAYQWVEQNQAAAEHSNVLRLQWRSPTGHAVHLLRGDMTVQYHADSCAGVS